MVKRRAAAGAVKKTPAYLRHYRQIVDKEGASFAATGWISPEMQMDRFRVMADMFDFNNRVVLDAGTGRGDFAVLLRAEGVQFKRFIGLDALPEMVEACRDRQIPDAEFHLCDFASDPGAFDRGEAIDVVTFSGSLNTLPQRRALSVLERAWAASGVGLVFNFLSARCSKKATAQSGDPARRFDPLAMLNWALDRTPSVRFRQDYFEGHDATIAMARPSADG